MKNKLKMIGMVCLSFFEQTSCVSFESKDNARKLVEVLFVKDITNDFHAGERSSQDRKRLREMIMNDEENPYRADEVNQRSLGQLLLWKARKIEQELARGKN